MCSEGRQARLLVTNSILLLRENIGAPLYAVELWREGERVLGGPCHL